VVASAEDSSVAFQRYRHHVFTPEVLPSGALPGRRHVVSSTTPLYQFCKSLCRTGGSWLPSPGTIAGYRLVGVEAIIKDTPPKAAYEIKHDQNLNQRHGGGDRFNIDINKFSADQLRVLSCLREQFQERRPGTNPKAVNTIHCFHGPRRECLDNICANGLVAVREMDAGFFGSGCYSTLNIEYAVKYAHGVFDQPRPRPPSADGRYPVIMFAASVQLAYPVTPDADYAAGANESKYFGRPLEKGFDCHVVCVNENTNFQAVNRPDCQYVEVVISQENQMLPLAVLRFEDNDA
jgi:hypothetical protein